MAFSTGSLIGVTITDGVTTPTFKPGTVVNTSGGGEAVYVSATSTIATYQAVIVDNEGGAVPVTTTNSAGSKSIWFSQVSIDSGRFGWVQRGGKVITNLAANCAPNVPLYTTATAGVLDDAVVSLGLVIGLVANTTISNATAVTCVASRGVTIGTGDMD